MTFYKRLYAKHLQSFCHCYIVKQYYLYSNMSFNRSIFKGVHVMDINQIMFLLLLSIGIIIFLFLLYDSKQNY